jgi:hypothetical protein
VRMRRKQNGAPAPGDLTRQRDMQGQVRVITKMPESLKFRINCSIFMLAKMDFYL